MRHVTIVRLAPAVLAAGLLLTAACSGSNNKANSTATKPATVAATVVSSTNATAAPAGSAAPRTSSPATAATRTAGPAAASGAVLSDCDYAKKLQASVLGFAGSVLGVLGDALSPATPGSDVNALAARAYDKLSAAADTTIKDLQGLNLPDDLKKVNNGVIAIFQDAKKQVADAKTAAAAGNLGQAQAIMSKANSDITSKFDQVEKENQAVVDRLNKCPS